ncbi:MAG: hypothetical protein JW895_01170 [Thermoleophilaceae bacterium]|nr:hypothetical protein [Thermoleophilaceae bacterium]
MLWSVQHVALALSVLALAGAASRVASPLSPDGLTHGVTTVVIAVCLAVAEALALGLVGLGTSAVALPAAAALTWIAAARLLPAPETGLTEQLARWWRGLAPAGRLVAGGLAGLSVAWLVWQLVHPAIGFDSSLYHYPFVAGWIENGRPGSSVALSYDIPYGNYPLTDEVANTWAAAISRSWIPLILWSPLMLGVLAAAGWLTLRNLGVGVAARALAVAAVVTPPVVLRQLNEAQTDLPALTWLACAAALATGTARRRTLLVPATLAAGLAIGTKPSTAPLAVAVLAIGAWSVRAELRRLAPWLVAGVAGAVVVGGIWYLRNIVEHGSPLWPFAPGPFGDPSPRFLGLVDRSFLDRPYATLDGHVGEYLDRVGGTWLLPVAAVPALALGVFGGRRLGPVRRPLVVSSGLALLMLLLWATAWGTGLSENPELKFAEGFALSGVRYALPAIACAAIAVALLTRLPGLLDMAAKSLLALVIAWNVLELIDLGGPWVPPAAVVAGGALAGAGLAALASRARAPTLPRLAVPALAVLAGLALSLAAPGVVERSAATAGGTAYGREVIAWFADQPWFDDEEGRPIAIASRGVVGQLAGDRFQHPLELVPQRASCAEVRRIAERRTLFLTPDVFFRGILGVEPYTAPGCLRRGDAADDQFPFLVYVPRATTGD